MKLAYRAVDDTGRSAADTIEATSTAEATETLRQQGLFVTEIAEVGGNSRAADGVAQKKHAKTKVKIKETAVWARQLCVLVRSGTPLAAALQAIENQTRPGPWREVLVDLRRHVEEGNGLSEAMARYPHVFDDVVQSLVAAGESAGQLGEMLDRAAQLTRQQLKLRRSLTSALIYPALLIAIGITVTLVMLIGVLPRFAELFNSLKAPLPPTTELLMGLSMALRSHWWAFLLGLGAIGAAIKLFLSGEGGRRRIDTCAINLPYVGKVVRSLGTARIARLMGVLLQSRVPMLEALRLTKRSTGNRHFAALMQEAINAATAGQPISSAFGRSDLINPAVSEAVRHGEANGQIGPILSDMADFLDEENEVIVKTTMSLIEPLILIVLGVVVAFIALSLFIPLFDLTATAGAS